ncbi:MAG TPA: hypothetical protein VGE05_03110 [Novosphingobium sp.]
MKADIRLAALLLLILPIALSACQSEDKPAQKGTAAGEILEGSASDAMLPLDTVRSQPPLAPRPEASGKAKEEDDEGADGEQPAADASAAPSAPASPTANASGAE